MRLMSHFERVPLAPPDPIFGMTTAFLKDPRPGKVNLGVGLYKGEDLKTPVLDAVKAAETALFSEEKSKDYLPIEGDPLYLEQIGALLFGEVLWKQERGRIAAIQSIGGTGALHAGGAFLSEEAKAPIYISNPTWPNHRGVFTSCGLPIFDYPYYDAQGFAFDKFHAFLNELKEGSIVLLHGACHNPTGCDPTLEEWKSLSALFVKKRLIPFFDTAYLGLGEGIEKDRQPLVHFLESGLEMLVAISNAKNFSLYGERVGALFVVTASQKEQVTSRLKQIARVRYSNPPMHGAKIVAKILSVPALRHLWERELTTMRERIQAMRGALFSKLQEKGIDLPLLQNGKGMFSYCGLTPAEVEQITLDYGIYLSKEGRINVCGLSHANLDYVAHAMCAVRKKDA
ncbi:MAG: aspartate/tyrosine/aromatic aminotransferase [Verrucomicrobia bacterium]|nr:aspartate/tyrosine/aromatic aminotransferase [Verrucomicrobiota bacterium]